MIKRLADSDREKVLFLIEKEELETLFLYGLVKDGGLSKCPSYGFFVNDILNSFFMYVKGMAPFGKNVLLPCGDEFTQLLPYLKNLKSLDPEMMMGSKKTTMLANRSWPEFLRKFHGKKDEILFIKTVSTKAENLDEANFYLATDKDVKVLSQFRINMEKDSLAQLISTEIQAEESCKKLIATKRLWVLSVKNELIGCCSITTGNARYLQLGFIYVLPEYRKRGYSDFMLISVCNKILEDNKIPLLFTDEKNEDLILRAECIGFERVSTHHKYYYL